MIFVWGWKARYKTLGEGMFHCPHDGGDRAYRLRQARRWFTFFWIPIIPLKVLGEFIECTSCQSAYDEKVLTMPTSAQIMDNLANATRQAVVSMITADGVVDESEKRVGFEIMQRYSDTPYTMSDLEEDIRNRKHGDLALRLGEVAGMLNEQGKENLLAACLEIAAADGSIDESELNEVRKAGLALGMSANHVKGVILHAQESLSAG
ncbi:MAG: TerB family tellurite resistance protein [Acidimicrobiia bacterium]|nr:TerB family tellurite resistance protein [Acidimicrobiia bacterium]